MTAARVDRGIQTAARINTSSGYIVTINILP